MVQRNSLDKLGIQVDSRSYVKTTTSLKPCPTQHSDIRNKGGGGTDLTKKMKKSRSFKVLSDPEILRTSPAKRGKPRLDMAPTDVTAAAAAITTTPKKSPLIKMSDESPNYMKSTSCSKARKERSEVSISPSTHITSLDNKSPSRLRGSNYPNVMKSLTKKSSLKPVRTLTKTSSTKSMRPSSRKSPEICLGNNQSVGRPTCSSTLKDSKFSQFAMLHSLGTESEGPSEMKVCPYTYCSLNGHHHAQLPPLNRFLSARRRLMRTQKSMRLKGLQPATKNPPENENKDVEPGETAGSAISSPKIDAEMDFFVEIYAPPRKATDELNGELNCNGDDETGAYLAALSQVLYDTSHSFIDGAETGSENGGGSIAESLSDESPDSEMSYEEHSDHNIDFFTAKTDVTSTPPSKHKKEEADDLYYESCFIREEVYLKYRLERELDGRTPAESEMDEIVSDVSDMDWEELTPKKPQPDDNFYVEMVSTDGCLGSGLLDKFISKQDDTLSKNSEGTKGNGGLHSVDDECCEFSVTGSQANPGVAEEIIRLDQVLPCINGGDQENDEVKCKTFSCQTICYSDPELAIEVDDSISQAHVYDGQFDLHCMVENHELPEPDQPESRDISIQSSTLIEWNKMKSTENTTQSDDEAVENAADIGLIAINLADAEEDPIMNAGSHNSQEPSKNLINLKKQMRTKKTSQGREELREFNPRGPRYLTVEADPENEKVDLRHQMVDERKSAEEWMLDYALQQAVTKLAPARKRRVSLLVEAFETITPESKRESHLHHARTTQAF